MMEIKPRVAFLDKGCDSAQLEQRFLTPSDRAYIAAFGSEKRQRELSLWRALLRRELCDMGLSAEVFQADIIYNEVGAPALSGVENIFFSVSHSRSVVAVMVSGERCAIDIEELSRDFDVVAERFSTEQERNIVGGNLALLWSAKECSYKLSGRRGLDLISDIAVVSADDSTKKIEIQTNLYSHTFSYSFDLLPNHVIVASSDF